MDSLSHRRSVSGTPSELPRKPANTAERRHASAHPAATNSQGMPFKTAPGAALAVSSWLGGVMGFILMYLDIAAQFNRAFLDLVSFATSGFLGEHVNFWAIFVVALLLAGSGIVCGHWARRRAQSSHIRTVAFLGLWGGYLTLALVAGLALFALYAIGQMD